MRELRVALALLEFVSVGDEHLAAELLRHFVLETRHLASLLRRGRWLASTRPCAPASRRPPACAHQGGCTDRGVHCGPASYIKLA